jgi:2-iminobutanoate/2-iminopropanoate deaminase
MFVTASVFAGAARRRAVVVALALLAVAISGCGSPDDGVVAAQDAAAQNNATDTAPEVTYLTTPEFEAMGFPFSEAVRVGHMLYLSGQVGDIQSPEGGSVLVEGGIQAETRQAMENIKDVLVRYGSSLDRVVKCTVMIDDMSEWPAMNEVYAPYFPDHKPARSAIGADGLALGAKVEIECWATVG